MAPATADTCSSLHSVMLQSHCRKLEIVAQPKYCELAVSLPLKRLI